MVDFCNVLYTATLSLSVMFLVTLFFSFITKEAKEEKEVECHENGIVFLDLTAKILGLSTVVVGVAYLILSIIV